MVNIELVAPTFFTNSIEELIEKKECPLPLQYTKEGEPIGDIIVINLGRYSWDNTDEMYYRCSPLTRKINKQIFLSQKDLFVGGTILNAN